MKFIVLFEDNEEFAQARMENMPAHLAFLRANQESIQTAGPLKEASGEAPAGGLWIIDVDSAKDAQQLVKSDPFWPTGLRKSVDIRQWHRVFADGETLI